MVFVTGDLHGNFERFKPKYFPEQAQMSVSMVIDGAGGLSCGGERLTLGRGDTFVTRAGCPRALLQTAQGMKVLRCYPPRP